MPRVRVAIEAERFRNYWIAKVGQGAVKRDWFATWRNWVLTAMENSHGAPAARVGHVGASSTAGRSPTGSDAVLAGMARLAHRLDQGREPTRSRRQVAH